MQPHEIAQLREQAFTGESLGNLGSFYRSTASAYERKFLEESKRAEQLKKNWEARFLAAEEAFKNPPKGQSFFPSFIDPVTGKSQKLFKVLDRSGKRLSYEEILKKDTSKRGNVFDVGQTALQILESLGKSSDYEKAMKRYQSSYQRELAVLEERNKVGKQKFLEDKQAKLDKLAASAYQKPTYTENPL